MRRLLSAPPVVLSTGHLHPWLRHTERGIQCAGVSLCFHGKCCIFCFSALFLWMLLTHQYGGQRDTHLYFLAMPEDQINIYTTAFGICGSSVLSVGWSFQWQCEGRVWIRQGSIWTSLTTKCQARTELLCLLLPSCWLLISHLYIYLYNLQNICHSGLSSEVNFTWYNIFQWVVW